MSHENKNLSKKPAWLCIGEGINRVNEKAEARHPERSEGSPIAGTEPH